LWKNGCIKPDGKPEIRRPEELERLIPPQSNISYDLEVFCGTKRYLEGFQREEIKKKLEVEHGIPISSREISVLANKFVGHFKQLHMSRSQTFRKALEHDGGTPWNVELRSSPTGGRDRDVGRSECHLVMGWIRSHLRRESEPTSNWYSSA